MESVDQSGRHLGPFNQGIQAIYGRTLRGKEMGED